MKITAYIKHTAVAALVVTIFAACSTDENFYYQDTPRVRLVGPETWARLLLIHRKQKKWCSI